VVAEDEQAGPEVGLGGGDAGGERVGGGVGVALGQRALEPEHVGGDLR